MGVGGALGRSASRRDAATWASFSETRISQAGAGRPPFKAAILSGPCERRRRSPTSEIVANRSSGIDHGLGALADDCFDYLENKLVTQIRRPLLLVVLFALSAAQAAAQTAYLTSWEINTTSATGHSTNATINGLVSQIAADVREVWSTSDYVYVKSSGVPSYNVGPFNDGNPAYPSDRNWQLRFARAPQAATTHTATPLGSNGLLVNGVPIYNPRDARSYNNQNIWHNNAVVVEANGFDAALGHPAPAGGGGNPVPGVYHHHQLSPSLVAQVGGISPTEFSPLLGFAFDGFPIYGPYGYANADGTGGIARMTSSYQQRSITQRHALSGGATLPTNQWGPDVGGGYPLGYFIEDYEFVSGLGLLDAYNGRFTVTPDFPQGSYAYFTTIDALGNNVYPYILGPSYYGVADTANSSGSVAIPGDAVKYNAADFNGDGIVDGSDFLQWQRGESRHALSVGDLNLWKIQVGAITAVGESNSEATGHGVPEPGTGALASLVAASLLGMRRRRDAWPRTTLSC